MCADIAMFVWNAFTNDARVLKEAQTLASAGHDVTVYALHTPGVTKRQERLASGVRVIRVPRRPFWRFGTNAETGGESSNGDSAAPPGKATSLRRFLNIGARLWTHTSVTVRILLAAPDVVHTHDVNTLPTGWLAARLCGARLVYDAHEVSTSREGYGSFRRLVAGIERRLMPRADATITTTATRSAYFARAYGVPRPLVLQNRPTWNPGARTNRLRRELGLKHDWPIILYQGGLQHGRGLQLLVDVARDVDNAYFIFMGGGPLEQPLKRQVRSLGLSERVRFVSTRSLEELPDYTASADIGVQPLENTCFNHFSTDSNKLFEYVAAGLVVVSSNLPEIRFLMQRWELGLLVAPGCRDQLRGALSQLVAQPSLRYRFQDNALKAARSLSWESQEPQLLGLYDAMLITRQQAAQREG